MRWQLLFQMNIGSPKRFCDIILSYKKSRKKNNENPYYIISSNSAFYTPLHYVLFFPQGDLG